MAQKFSGTFSEDFLAQNFEVFWHKCGTKKEVDTMETVGKGWY